MDYSKRLQDSLLVIRLQSYQAGFPPAKYHDLSLAAQRTVPVTILLMAFALIQDERCYQKIESMTQNHLTHYDIYSLLCS